MKKSILLFAALCCILSLLTTQKALAKLVTVCYNGVYYTYSDVDNADKTAVVTCQYESDTKNFDYNYSGLSGDVVIPSKISNIYTVTKIRYFAFGYKKQGGVFNVTLPSTIEKIEYSAFSNATKLYSIRLNEGLKEIGDYIFNGCSALTEAGRHLASRYATVCPHADRSHHSHRSALVRRTDSRQAIQEHRSLW